MNWNSLKIGFHVIRKHPSLLLKLPGGEISAAIAHMEIELKRAFPLYDKCIAKGMTLDEMVDVFQREICHPNAYLYPICRNSSPNVFVETGVHWGGSTAFVLQAMHGAEKGHLWSIDLPNVVADARNNTVLSKGMETGFLVPKHLRTRWTLILGDARIELPKLLNELGEIDAFHHDSLHTYDHMSFEYGEAWPRLKANGLFLSDDVQLNPAFEEFCRAKGETPKVFSGKGLVMKSRA